MVSSLLFLILHIFILEKGLVIKNTGSWYLVKTDEGKLIECKIKGNFRLKGIRSTNPIAVGDRVQINVNAEGTAFITEIEDRKNYIIRRSSNLSKQSHIIAANLDQCMLVVTVNYPETSTVFIDRFLASAEAYRVPVCLVFNKVDRYTEEELHYLDGLTNLYTHIGYPVLPDFCLGRYGSRRNQTGIRRKSNLIFRPLRCGKIHPYQCHPARTETSRREKSPPHITKVCTPPHSQKCFRWQATATSLTHRVSRDSVRST